MSNARLVTLLFVMTTLAGTASADIPPIPEETTVVLAPRATCPAQGQTGAIPLRPPCSFEGWNAQIGPRTLPAEHAAGARWLPSCAVDDQGACGFAVTATGRIQGNLFAVQSYTVAPVGHVTATGKVLVPKDVMCTEEECAQDQPCCHECSHGGWRIASKRPDVPACTAADVPDLPLCELDGCGGCAHQLTAWGVEVGDLFIVSSHGETGALALSPMGKCTLMACMSANPCCNTCGFMGWSALGASGSLKAIPGDGVEPLPPCELDGCGQCSWQLLVSGEEKGGTFVVTQWERFPAGAEE